MGGTRAGGLKAAQKNKELYGKDFYKNLGKIGGSRSHQATRFFALHPDIAKTAGAKGGKTSTRKGIKNGQGKKYKKLAELIKEDVKNV